MRSIWNRSTIRLGTILAGFILTTAVAAGQTGTKNGEWPTWGGDLGNTRYAPFDQINASNFNSLEVAWRFKTDNLGPRPEFNLQSTPLMVHGILYSTGGTRRAVVALDATTGELHWTFSVDEGKRGAAAPRKLSGRGLSYWTDGREERIIYVTPGYQMIALDAKTGRPIPTFGKNGVVDLKLEDDQEIDLETGEVGLHSTPVIANGVVIVGAAHLAGGNPKSMKHVKGFVRGYDVRTGKRLWIFHTIPMSGEFGIDTWEGNSASYTGNAGVWTQMAIDEELNTVYLPVEAATGDYYGGHRPGDDLFSDSLVAVDLKTGKRKWHFQTVHHEMWDLDIACPPILGDIVVDGRTIKAVWVSTKQGFVFVFDRTNGKPVWPIVETPVPQSDVPGEKTSATQPIPTKPPPFLRPGVTIDDLIDFTPELRAAAIEMVKNYKMGPVYTPEVVSTWPRPLGTLVKGPEGGANWPGGSFDPETHIFYVYSHQAINSLGLVPGDPSQTDMRYVSGRATDPNPQPAGRGRGGAGEGASGLTIQGLPLGKPPYGRITAFDMNKGEILWDIPHGETPDNVKNNPALKGLTIPRTGRFGLIGTLATKSLVIAGEAGFVTAPNGQRGAMLRAYDKMTGKEVGAVFMPAPQTGSPMTYMLNGKQYLVVAISGAGYSGELVAFTLPGDSSAQ
jgi:quinoprotein glucose dehydrogenase